MTTIVDLTPHLILQPYSTDLNRISWHYEFPNDHVVSVKPDPERPFQFEVKVDRNDPVRGLTTDQVEAKLMEWYSLSPDEPTVAYIYPVDLNGQLQPNTVVSVGEWSWPVSEEVPDLATLSPHIGWAETRGRRRPGTGGRTAWMCRVERTLRDRGWEAVDDPRLAGGPGVYEVPIKRTEPADASATSPVPRPCSS